MTHIKGQGSSGGSIRNRIEWFLVGEPFWNLWGGRIFNTLIMSAMVAWCLQMFDNQVRQFVDTTVQSTLLNRMSSEDFSLPTCDHGSEAGLAYCITVIGVDDQDFRGTFKQQSPLDPTQLQLLFDKMRQYPPIAVAVDLDLSPASESDIDARNRLRTSLLKLSRLTHLIMVCPQGYSTPEPGELDRQWVSSFQGAAQFSLADLDADGLYYRTYQAKEGEIPALNIWQMQTLGVATAMALRTSKAENEPSVKPQGKDWDIACKFAGPLVAKELDQPEKRLIRPSPVNAISFSQALAAPEALRGRIVVLGGKWGVNDSFALRGQSDHFFGVNLHSWVLASELAPLPRIPEAVEQLIDITIGMLCGIIFHFFWKKITIFHDRYAYRTFFYIGFFIVAIGVPLGLILGTVFLAKIGLTLSVAGMILSSAADSFTSAHEPHDGPRKTRDIVSRFSVSAWGGLCGVLLLVTLFGWFAGWHAGAFGFLGATLGMVFAWADTKDRGLYAEFQPSQKETGIDLLVRFLWMCLRLFLLLSALWKQESATVALELAFMGTWLVAVYMGRQRASSRPVMAP